MSDDTQPHPRFTLEDPDAQVPDAHAATDEVARALEAVAPPGASASVLAVRADDGRVVAARDPDRAVAPASNTKLLTAALALDRLGADHRFDTNLFARGDIEGRTLDGDLVVVGTGAPDLDATDLAALAEGAADHLDLVEGSLLADTSRFEGPQLGPGRVWSDAHHPYGARSSALALGGNVVEVTVDAGGEEPAVVAPDGDAVPVEVDVEVVATGPGEGADDGLAGRPAPDGSGVRVEGALPPGERRTVAVPVPDPVERCLRRTLAELDAAGVAVAGGLATATDRATGGRHGEPLARVRSARVRELVEPMAVDSDNLVADQLARAVAAAETGTGSWDGWTSVVDDHLDGLGVTAGRVRDGSGLSRYDRLTARGVVASLAWAADQPWGGTLFDALPAPGEGTLADRLDGTRVAAKTGTLTGARALSGRLGGDDPLLFSVLVGGITVGADGVRDRQDALVRALAAVAHRE